MRLIDNVVHGTKHRAHDGQRPEDTVCRYEVLKKSWKGSNRRIFCITATGVETQLPNLQPTNVFPFYPDLNITSITVVGSELVLNARAKDKVRLLSSMTRLCHAHRNRCSTACLRAGAGTDWRLFCREVRHPVPSPSGKRAAGGSGALLSPQPEALLPGTAAQVRATLLW